MTIAVVTLILVAVGGLVSAIGGIMLIVAAFQVSAIWGLAVLLLPFAGIVFAVTHWQEAKKAFLVSVAGMLVCSGAFFAIVAAGRPTRLATGESQEPGHAGGGIFERIRTRIESARNSVADRMEAATSSAGPTSYVGRPLRDVRAKLGRPKGEMRFGRKTAWMYEDFMILSEDGETVQAIVDSKDYEAMKNEMEAAPTEQAGTTAKPAESANAISNGAAGPTVKRAR